MWSLKSSRIRLVLARRGQKTCVVTKEAGQQCETKITYASQVAGLRAAQVDLTFRSIRIYRICCNHDSNRVQDAGFAQICGSRVTLLHRDGERQCHCHEGIWCSCRSTNWCGVALGRRIWFHQNWERGRDLRRESCLCGKRNELYLVSRRTRLTRQRSIDDEVGLEVKDDANGNFNDNVNDNASKWLCLYAMTELIEC